MTKNHGKNTGFILLIVGAAEAGKARITGLYFFLNYHMDSLRSIDSSSESCRAKEQLESNLDLAQR